MSKEQHTPGPWDLFRHDLNGPARQTYEVKSVFDGKSEIVAIAYGSTLDEAEANARLIAQAPELQAKLVNTEDSLAQAEAIIDEYRTKLTAAEARVKELEEILVEDCEAVFGDDGCDVCDLLERCKERT